MAKKRKKKSSGPITPLLLVLSFLIATLGVYSYIRFRPVGPAEIFVIEPVALTEGEIAITGTLIKDAPAGEPGTYLLILADNTAIILDIQDADLLLGMSVTAQGILTLPSDNSTSPFLIVSRLTTN